MPFHPRTIISLRDNEPVLYRELQENSLIRIIPPVSYLEMILLERSARMIITDSGGVQKESHFFKKPCLVLRKETEWTELVKNGTAILVDADAVSISDAFEKFNSESENLQYPGFYGNGRTSEFILREILMLFGKE
jgi:UDP-GlcNAc3NAcA epimerase